MTPEQVIALAALIADQHAFIGHLQAEIASLRSRLAVAESQLATQGPDLFAPDTER